MDRVIVVFTGPTIHPDAAGQILAARYRPPASQGDVYRVAAERPFAIGIIDGYFERVPAVWHKEILWALSQGIHVYGSASMGALRAAELAPFGMHGVGEVFAQFRDGTLEDDDEVALRHAPEPFGYKALSEPMVNIRHTLRCAASAGTIRPAAADLLVRLAKDLHYEDRRYDAILEQGAARGVDPTELDQLRAWLPGGRVDVKRNDAAAMLHALSDLAANGTPCPPATFMFETTALWIELVRFAGMLNPAASESDRPLFVEDLVRQVEASGELTSEMRELVMARILALDESRRHGFQASNELVASTIVRLRARLGLATSGDLEQWMDANDLDLELFLALVDEEARLWWTRSLLAGEIEAALLNHLRSKGLYARLRNAAVRS